MEKHFYAEYSDYGIQVGYTGGGYVFRAFEKKADRDAWLAEHDTDRNGNIVAGPVDRKTVAKVMGQDFRIGADGFVERAEK